MECHQQVCVCVWGQACTVLTLNTPLSPPPPSAALFAAPPPQSLQSSGHPELLERLNKTIGFGMGLEFREGEWACVWVGVGVGGGEEGGGEVDAWS